MKRALALASAVTVLALTPAIARADGDDFEHHFTGRVLSFQPYNLQLDRGPHIFLHTGTVIHPTGLNLHNGQVVVVYGHRTDDGNFSADEIDLIPPAPPWYRR
jgi:hypothetical protein